MIIIVRTKNGNSAVHLVVRYFQISDALQRDGLEQKAVIQGLLEDSGTGKLAFPKYNSVVRR
jgi:hypothetical protein